MAVKDNKPAAWFKRVNKTLDDLGSSMDSIYQSTYASRSDNKNNMDFVVSSIGDTIDKIINTDDSPKISDISNLYVRLQKKRGVPNGEIINNAMELFSDNGLINTLSMNQEINRYIQAEDYQYDTICKYMPAIETALEIKQDNVLSSDNFSKNFIKVESTSLSKEKQKIFDDNVETINRKYKFQDICEEMYQRAAKYGECFLYIVPYNIAMERLLKRRSTFTGSSMRTFGESARDRKKRQTIPNKQVIFESSNIDADLKKNLDKAKISMDMMENCSVNLIFDDNAIFSEAIEAREKAISASKKSKLKSLTEQYNILTEAKKEDSSVTVKTNVATKLSSSTLQGGVNDGLIVGNKSDNGDKIDDINGCVISFIERGDILPIYMDNLCVGYYHFNFSIFNDSTCEHGFPTGFQGQRTTDSNSPDMMNDMLLSFISQKISDNIDAHFINANKDLKEEIYSILKYNDKFNVMNGVNDITVSFLPADDVFHFFLKQDRKTHRGISSIKKALVPAMLYCLLYLTNTIGQVTRAQDKRIYYVKQNVETNVARTLMNVINQIKKGNMGMRQIQSMNSILNIVGKYNDHVIPVGQSGDAPVQFEVMSGQEVRTPSELMEQFKDDAVASTDVPYEFVQTVNQVDYATRFTMSNSKFLRKVYKEQRICQEAFSYVFTKIYNYEFGENERSIKIMLPAPAFLNMTNSEQLIANTTNYMNAITEVELANEDDNVKNEFKRIMMRQNLGNYIDYDKVDNAILEAKMAVSASNNGDNGGDSY